MSYPNDPQQPSGTQWSGPPPTHPPASDINGMAIAALVCAILFAPLGIVLGHIARRQINRSGEGGLGLATAGLIIGYIFTAILLVAIVVAIVLAVAYR